MRDTAGKHSHDKLQKQIADGSRVPRLSRRLLICAYIRGYKASQSGVPSRGGMPRHSPLRDGEDFRDASIAAGKGQCFIYRPEANGAPDPDIASAAVQGGNTAKQAYRAWRDVSPSPHSQSDRGQLAFSLALLWSSFLST